MTEEKIENKLVQSVKKLGLPIFKLTSEGTNGLPDRLILLPKGKSILVELKRPKGGRIASLQKYWNKILTELGYEAYFISTVEQVEELTRRLKDELRT